MRCWLPCRGMPCWAENSLVEGPRTRHEAVSLLHTCAEFSSFANITYHFLMQVSGTGTLFAPNHCLLPSAWAGGHCCGSSALQSSLGPVCVRKHRRIVPGRVGNAGSMLQRQDYCVSASIAVWRDGAPGDPQEADCWGAVGHPAEAVTVVRYPHERSHSF